MSAHSRRRPASSSRSPASGLDPGHAEVAFVGRHFGLTKIRGRFTGVAGAVVIADDIAESTSRSTIDMASVSSGDQSRDDHLRSPDFFDVAAPPDSDVPLRPRSPSTGIARPWRASSPSRTSPARSTSTSSYLGHAADPWGNDRAVFSATGARSTARTGA